MSEKPPKTNLALLSVPQAAESLSIKPATVRAWVLHRRIAYHKIGGAVRIPAAEIERIIRDGAVPAREARHE